MHCGEDWTSGMVKAFNILFGASGKFFTYAVFLGFLERMYRARCLDDSLITVCCFRCAGFPHSCYADFALAGGFDIPTICLVLRGRGGGCEALFLSSSAKPKANPRQL